MNILEKYLNVLRASDGGGMGGGSSAPASGGAAAAPESTPASGGGTLDSGASSEGDWGDIPEDLDFVEMQSVEPTAKQPEVAPATGQTGAPPIPGADAARAKPTAEVTSPPTASPPPASASSEADVDVTLDNIDTHFSNAEDGLIQSWADNFFQLSEAETEALTTNPEQVLPRLLAKVLFHATRSVPAQIKNFVPGLISSHVEKTRVQNEARDEFFSAWPGLKGQNAAAARAIRTVREQSPQANRATVIKLAGQMACIMLGIDPTKAGQVAASTSGGNGMSAHAARTVAPPFRPAGAGASANGTGGTMQPGVMVVDSDDEWAGMGLPNSDR